MANELQRLQELNSRLQLVPKGQSVEQLLRNASDFTHEAAKLLHADGYRRIRKTEGTRIDEMDVDKLVHKDTFQIFDIVARAGAPDAFVAWQHVGELRDSSRFIEVRPDVPRPTPTPAPAPPRPIPAPTDDELLKAIRDIVDVGDVMNHQLERIAVALERLEAFSAAIRHRLQI